MSENITLDRIDFEKITQQAKAARAVYLRRYIAAVVAAIGSTFASVLQEKHENYDNTSSSGEAAHKCL